MKSLRTTRKLQQKKTKRHGGSLPQRNSSLRETRKTSAIKKQVIFGPTETREFHPSPTEQEIVEADLQNKKDYYTEKLARTKSSNASLHRKLNEMKTTFNTRNKQLSEKYKHQRQMDNVTTSTRGALLKIREQITELEAAILEIESEIAANDYKIARYQQFIAQPQLISRSLQAHRRHEARKHPRTRITNSDRGQKISFANQKLRENRPYKTG
jgi:chromosome segregation ATPase